MEIDYELESSILFKLSNYIGQIDTNLLNHYGIRKNPNGKYPKSIKYDLVRRMLDLDISENFNDKFKDSNISIKTIRVQKNGRIRESMSLPAFSFNKLVQESWEKCDLRTQFCDTRYLFIVWQEIEEGQFKFDGAKFWSMPEEDLEETVKAAWELLKKQLLDGVQLVYDSNSGRVTNNLLSKQDDMIIHVRPKAPKSSYIAFSNYAEKLPVKPHWYNKPDLFSDDWMTKQGFFLNNTYIQKQIQDLIQ